MPPSGQRLKSLTTDSRSMGESEACRAAESTSRDGTTCLPTPQGHTAPGLSDCAAGLEKARHPPRRVLPAAGRGEVASVAVSGVTTHKNGFLPHPATTMWPPWKFSGS
jgi:hypothetical protein